jgi:pimeloyl-ACP methyl ester carboxylesterase
VRPPVLLACVLLSALAGGCALITEPLEERYLFTARPADPERYASILRSQEGVEEVRIQTEDGATLHGLLKRAPAAKPGERYPLVVVFGGARRETSWILGRGDKPRDWGWLLVNYRGYGLSRGKPSEDALKDDARQIFDWAVARPDVDASRIVAMGRSLGSYVAVSLANTRPVHAVILATPFDSIAAIGEKRYPYLPLQLLVGHRYNSIDQAPDIKKPALFLLADNDTVTPAENGEALAKAWGGPKRVLTIKDASHYGIEWREDYWREIGQFLGGLSQPAGKP